MSDTDTQQLQSQSSSSDRTASTSPDPHPHHDPDTSSTSISASLSRTNSPTSGGGADADTELDFDFIQSPLKRQYFRDSQSQSRTPSPSKETGKMGQEMEVGTENGGSPGSPTPQAQVHTSFTPPAPVISYDHGVKAQIASSDPVTNIGANGKQQNANPTKSVQASKGASALEATFVRDETERPYQPTTTPLYTKTHFSSIEKFIGSSGGSGSGSGLDPEKGNAPEYKTAYLPDDNVKEALLAFFLSTFNLVFSAGMGYWHLSGGLKEPGYNSFVILIIGGLFMKLAFIFNRDIKVWKECKPIFLLCIIPFFTAFSLSFADFIFTAKVAQNKSYVRPWTNTRMVYLVESLALAFPQCVYQSMVMVEDPNSLITVKGMITLCGLGILVYSMAFARIRYDSMHRPHRFGSGLEKVIRSVIIGSHKGLWVVTYVCALVAARMQFNSATTLAVLVTLGVLLASLELPMLVSSFRLCEALVVKYTWVFFMLPQFVFLVALIYWVNVDPGLYETNVGVCLLGAASLFESIVLMGWLLDTCNDRDSDVMASYPHFIGDLWNRSDKRRSNES